MNGHDSRLHVIEAAHSIVSFHVAGADGFCAGCQRQWGRMTISPCEQGRWAVRIIETHGAAQWNSGPTAHTVNSQREFTVFPSWRAIPET